MTDQPSAGHGRGAADDVNRQLYYADNLPVLRGMVSESVDLVYLDPPFNSDRAYNIIYPGDLGQVTAFEDTWYWDVHCDAHLRQLARRAPAVHRLLNALVEGMGKVQMCAYLVNMGVRLVELHRILKPTGSLYLHCDDSAGHYLKVMLDAVFGPEQFRNDIAWRRSTAHNDPARFGRILDSLLFYGKSGDMYWDGHSIATPKSETELAKAYPASDERGRYRSADLTGPLHGWRAARPAHSPGGTTTSMPAGASSRRPEPAGTPPTSRPTSFRATATLPASTTGWKPWMPRD